MTAQPAYKPDPRPSDTSRRKPGEVLRFSRFGGRGGGSGGERNGPRSPSLTRSAFGMWLALAPLLMFFMALVSAYVVRQGLGGAWGAFDIPGVLWINTLILIASSVTLDIGRRGNLSATDGAASRHWIWVTFGLGGVFLAGQILAWMQLTSSGLGVRSTPYGSYFYVLSGAHALHLAGGVAALLVAAAWPARGRLAGKHPAVLRNTSIYWHFMDVIWVGLFLLLVFWR